MIKSILMFPFHVLWFCVKLVVTVFLLFLGPFGWGILIGMWNAKNRRQHDELVQAVKDNKVVVDKNGSYGWQIK